MQTEERGVKGKEEMEGGRRDEGKGRGRKRKREKRETHKLCV